MLAGPWEIMEEKTGWHGVNLCRARNERTGEEYLLEDLALATAIKERICLELAAGLEAIVRKVDAVEHPALRKAIGLTKHGERYYLVRPAEDELWAAWGLQPRPAGPQECGEWLQVMAEITAAYHQNNLNTRGLSRVDLIAASRGLLVLEPIAQAYLGAYRDKNTFTRFELAPEYSRRGSWSAGADLFALGATAYELAAGRAPFAGEGADLIANLFYAAVPDPRCYRPEIGPGLARVIMALLERDDKKRPDARAVAAALAGQSHLATPEEQAEFGRGGRKLAQRLAGFEKLRAFMWKRRTLIRFAAGLCLGCAIFFLLRGKPPAPTITGETSPSQVVTAFYQAIGDLDQEVMEEALARGVDRTLLNMVINVYVMHRAMIAQGNLPLDLPSPLKVRNLELTRLAESPPRYVARYELALEKGEDHDRTEDIAVCEDHLTMNRRKDRRVGEKWVISELRHETLSTRTVPLPPRKPMQGNEGGGPE